MPKFILLALLFALISPLKSHACFAAPDPIEWGKSPSETYLFKRENKLGRITVYKADNKKKPLWRVSIPKFDNLFPSIYVTDTGKTLIHVRSNYQVKKITDTAVHVFQRGKKEIQTFTAQTFIKKILPSQSKFYLDPKQLWKKRVFYYDDKSLCIENANKEKVTISLLKPTQASK